MPSSTWGSSERLMSFSPPGSPPALLESLLSCPSSPLLYSLALSPLSDPPHAPPHSALRVDREWATEAASVQAPEEERSGWAGQLRFLGCYPGCGLRNRIVKGLSAPQPVVQGPASRWRGSGWLYYLCPPGRVSRKEGSEGSHEDLGEESSSRPTPDGNGGWRWFLPLFRCWATIVRL